MRIDVVSIFPGYLAPLRESLIGRAVERGVLELGVHDLRQWTHDVHRTVDDSPYGGGPGMLMRPEPWGAALDALAPAAGPRQPRLVVPSPAGRPFTQALAQELAAEPWLMFACGRYEGIDARVAEYAADRMRTDEVSLGDYVLAGGEVAVLVIVLRRAARRARLHPAGGLARASGTGGAALRAPRGDCPLAPGRGAAPYRGPPARSVGVRAAGRGRPKGAQRGRVSGTGRALGSDRVFRSGWECGTVGELPLPPDGLPAPQGLDSARRSVGRLVLTVLSLAPAVRRPR
jgi:hypothetical protein